MLIQQVSNTSACPETVANTSGNPEIKNKGSSSSCLVLHASLVLYLEYKQYRTRIIAFVSPFTISVDTQSRDNKTRWEVLAILEQDETAPASLPPCPNYIVNLDSGIVTAGKIGTTEVETNNLLN